MRHKIISRLGNKPLVIEIRCDDECRNGHDSWAITADLYKEGTKSFTERNWESGGCLHDEILKAKKSLKPFIDLHLSDGEGVPMYAVENGFYYYSAQYPSPSTWFEALCNHLRIDSAEGNSLIESLNSIPDNDVRKSQFSAYCEKQKPRWKAESEAAKTQLKKLIDGVIPA